ncbi:MAG: sugar phosphate isomerase/epimerase [Candidatus Dormibacteraeota bacterium]|nr:sugar phosphate isomerase/epimerase [Candidatus Dormibacteraeota bacterium]
MTGDRWRLSAFGDEIADSLEDQCRALAEHGVGLVELRSAWGTNVGDFDSALCDRALGVLRDFDIGVSAIGSPLGKVPAQEPPDEEQPRLERCLEAAERLGTRLVRVFSYYVLGQYEPMRDTVLRRLEAMAEAARRRDLVLVLENESWIYGDLPERCVDVLRSVDSPALRFAFDPANFVQCGADPMEAWPLLRPYVAHVHIKDAVPVDRAGLEPYPAPVPHDRLMDSVRPAGEGAGRIPELVQALAAEGYQGILTLEPHLAGRLPDADGAERFGVAVAALRKVVTDAGLESGVDVGGSR